MDSMSFPEKSTKIEIDDLERVFALLIGYLRERTGDRATIDTDYFWSFGLDERFDYEHGEEKPSLGQVSDSWEFARRVLAGDIDPIGHDFVWFGEVMIALGHADNKRIW